VRTIDFRRIDLDGLDGLNFTTLLKAVTSRERLTSLTLVVADHCGSHEDRFIFDLLDQLSHLSGLSSLDVCYRDELIPPKTFSLPYATYVKLSKLSWTASVKTDVVRFFKGLPAVNSLDLSESDHYLDSKICQPVTPKDLDQLSHLPIFKNLRSLRIAIPQGKDMAARVFFQLELPLLTDLYISAKDYDGRNLCFNVFNEMAGVKMPSLEKLALLGNHVYPSSAQFRSIKKMLANKYLAKLKKVKVIFWCTMYWYHEKGVNFEDMDKVNMACRERGVLFQLRYPSGNRIRWNGETSEGKYADGGGESEDTTDDGESSEVEEADDGSESPEDEETTED
jgi:hypothetical protein